MCREVYYHAPVIFNTKKSSGVIFGNVLKNGGYFYTGYTKDFMKTLNPFNDKIHIFFAVYIIKFIYTRRNIC